MSGTLFGVGLGPGDPDLLTVKATRVLERADVVAYFAKAGRRGHARAIAGSWLKPGCTEVPLHYPITTEVPFAHADYAVQLSDFYADAADRLAHHLEAGRDVALICEGDPLFYGSFMHLYARLKPRFPTAVVPGVTGMSGCWTAAGAPMTWGDDTLTVLPGTLPADALRERLAQADAVVLMKIGQNLAKVRAALHEAGLLDRALYVERGTMEAEVVMRLADKPDDEAPYFSVVLVPGEGRRP
ncbi:precorrin-2 C(20)-methyltransferase [Lichenihabitans sp. Uapishka_5]|uniref:precorrin-2 C(20)-methyltransferase n=1 Tax=Lichenihabitans sp. Uapishka_5 TaxID=3037302 RepID=UPI0029E81C0D|nr:precorrin-2 C(20)-methyltransferase [Lichenihabitans sp. Uapishka_5]MDX7953554.1 precorrin-2 C(20)-methyltransferase [Lichenihabitans sp. Uapishka_5]